MKWVVKIEVGTVDAENSVAAEAAAYELLESLAGSNDGSEVLANATPEVSATDIH
jgi:hypothetical protein